MVENLFNDDRANLYFKTFYINSNYNISINDSNEDLIIDSSPRSISYDIIRCKYNKDRNAHMQDNDIHNSFTDFIISVAILHKNIDKSSEAGTRLQNTRNILHNYIKYLTYPNYKDVDKTNLLSKIPSEIYVKKNNSNLELFEIFPNTKNTITILQYFFSNIFINVINDKVSYNNIIKDKETISYIVNKKINDSFINMLTHNILRCNGLITRNLDSMSKINYATKNTKYSLDGILYKLKLANNNVDINHIEELIKINLKKTLQYFAITVLNRLFLKTNSYDKTIILTNLKFIITETIDSKAWMNNLNIYIVDNIMQDLKTYLNNIFIHQHKTLKDKVQYDIWNNIYNNWNKYSDKDKNIINTYISLLHKNNKIDISSSIDENKLYDYRLNINKTHLGSNISVFENSIPLIPSKVKSIWYTSKAGIKKIDNKDKYFMRKLYHNIYTATTNKIKINGEIIEILSIDKYNNNFNLDIEKIVRNRMYNISHLKTNNLTSEIEPPNIIENNYPDVHKLLLEDDNKKLHNYLSNISYEKYNENIKNELKNLNPIIGFRVLQKYGFKNINDNNITKIESTKEWLNNTVNTKLTLHDNKINKKLVHYFDNLVNYINSYPSLLNFNKDITIAKNLKNTKLKNVKELIMSKYNFLSFGHNIKFNNGKLITPFGNDIIPRFKNYNIDLNINSSIDFLTDVIKSVFKNANSCDKQITNDGKKYVNKLLNNLNSLELNIIQTLKYINEYNSLIEIWNDGSVKNLSHETLQKILNKYYSLLEKYKTTEINILSFIDNIDEYCN